MLWFSGSIKYSSCMCFPTYYSSAGGLNKPQLCKLVRMFRFLWISAGPTYSALPVNAKDISGDIHFRRKLLFHWLWIFRCSYTCSRSSGSELCLLSIFTHSCVYLAFRQWWSQPRKWPRAEFYDKFFAWLEQSTEVACLAAGAHSGARDPLAWSVGAEAGLADHVCMGWE